MIRSHSSNVSRYIRTSWRLSATSLLKISECDAVIRYFSKKESEQLNEIAQRHNPFIRRPYGNLFYTSRIDDLAEKTVIEIFKPGVPAVIGATISSVASIIETIVVLSSLLNMNRVNFQKNLAIDKNQKSDFELVIGGGYKSFRSKSVKKRIAKGITIDGKFVKRFQSNGLPILLRYCQTKTDLATKVINALSWLIDSRQEPLLSAAIVKSSIALESLLVFNDSEPLSRSLSERCAFLLSSQPTYRAIISKIVKEFYNLRSGVVHGGRQKVESISLKILESIDRFVILMCLILSANEKKWLTKDDIRNWCDLQKWDAPDHSIVCPFSSRYLLNAIKITPVD